MDLQHLLVGTERGLYFLPTDLSEPLSSPAPFAFDKMEVDPVGRDAGDPTILYASVDQQELWRSEDRGQQWTKIWGPPEGARLYTILPHPVKPGFLYAGLEPAAAWTSEDGGRSWHALDALQRVPDKSEWRFFPPRHAHVRALAVRVDGRETLYVGIEEGGVYGSEDGGKTFHSLNEGIYRDIHTIRPFPGDLDLLFATTGDGLYRSSDRGRHWSHINKQGITRSYTVPLLIDPAAPHTMLVAAAAAPPPSWKRGQRGADALIFRSRDRGLTWQVVTTGLPSPQKGMVYCLLAHPKDPPNSFARLFAGTTDGNIYTSSDQGDHWKLMASGLPEVYSLAWVP